MITAILAGLCMFVQDTLSVIKFQAASRNRGWIVAILDSFIYIVTIVGVTIAAFTLHGNNLLEKGLVMGWVIAGTVGGSLLGAKIGERYVEDENMESLEARVKALEDEHASG